MSGVVEETMRGTAKGWKVAPATAAQYAVLAGDWPSLRIGKRRVLVIILLRPVLAALPNIPVHVVEPPRIGCFLSDRMSRPA